MSLNIIYGRSHTGKSDYITNIIKQKAECNEKVILVVPEQFTHAAELRILRATGKIQDDLLEITSFKRLANRTRAMVGDMRADVASAIGKSLVLSDVIENTQLDYYTGCVDSNGFCKKCLDTVSELKKHCITPDELKKISDDISDPMLKLKLGDIHKIYENYNHNLHNSYVDTDDILDILEKHLQSNNLYNDFTFFFDEFTSFIPQERKIIEHILSASKDVYVTLCMDNKDTSGLFRPADTTFAQLIQMCKDKSIKVNTPVFLEKTSYSSPELAFIEKNLFEYPTKVYGEKNENVSLVRAANPYSEVETAAVTIKSLVRDEKIRYKDISVICSDISNYDHIFSTVFRKHKIPYFTDEKVPVLNHPIILFVLNVLDVYLDNYSYESIFNFLKSAFSGFSARNIALIENFIIKTNASKNTWLNDERWDVILDNYCADDCVKKTINEIREKIIQPLAIFHDTVKGRNSVRFIAEHMYNYLCSLGIEKTVMSYIKKFRVQGDNARVREYEAVWHTVVCAFDEIVCAFNDKKVNLKQFRNYLYIAFSQQSIGLIPTSLDEITIGDIARTRLDDTKILFVLGANEGLFPMSAKSDVIISDREKESIVNLGYELPNSSYVQAFVNQHLIYTVFTSADKKLYVSYSVADSEYSTLAPAFSALRLKKMFPGIERGEYDFSSDDIICDSQTAKEHLVSCINNSYITDQWSSVYNFYLENEPDFILKIKKYFRYVNIADVLSDENVRQHIGDEFYTTVSRIQRYSACHFSYFADYMLKLKEKPVSDLKSVDIGTIAHNIIENICNGMNSDGVTFRRVPEGYFEDKIDCFVNEYIQQLGYVYAELTRRQLYAVERLKNILVLSFDAIAKQISQSKFDPVGYEVTFDNDNIGCIDIPLDNGTLHLTGKIDRVDAYETDDKRYVRVIDYKTGKKSFNLNDIIHGLDIQLMVYLNALVEADDKNDYGGAFFFLLDDFTVDSKHDISDEKISEKLESAMKLKGILLDKEEVKSAFDKATVYRNENIVPAENFKWLSRYIKQMIKELWQSLEGGDISLRPYRQGKNKTPCAYCPYKSLCRFDSAKGFYRQLKNYKKQDAWAHIKGGTGCVD